MCQAGDVLWKELRQPLKFSSDDKNINTIERHMSFGGLKWCCNKYFKVLYIEMENSGFSAVTFILSVPQHQDAWNWVKNNCNF